MIGRYMNANIYQNFYRKYPQSLLKNISLPTFFDAVNKRKYRHGLDMIDETHTTQYSLFEYLVYFFHVSLTDIEFIPFV